MASGFTFPPPPPPPSSRKAQPSQEQAVSAYGGAARHNASYQAARGGAGGLWNGRPQVLPPGSYVNPNFGTPNHSNVGPRSPYQNEQTTSRQPDRTYAGHKRKLEAFKEVRPNQMKLPKAETAPAVPSFGFLPAPPGQSPAASQQPSSSKTPSKSLFGSGVTQEEPSYIDSDEADADYDIDEEAAYAGQLGTKLVFEYEGQITTLDNEADLARWQQERRSRFPTSDRVAEKEAQRRIIGQERRRLLVAAYALTRPNWSRQTQDITQSASNATREEEPSPEASHRASAPTKLLLGLSNYDSEDEDDEIRTKPIAATQAETTAVEDSDDEPPEVSSSKVVNSMVLNDQRPACRYFFATGRCKEGKACRFRHDAEAERPLDTAARHKTKVRNVARPDKSQKKGIHQLLKDQENAAADALALKVIKHLGAVGFFNDSNH